MKKAVILLSGGLDSTQCYGLTPVMMANRVRIADPLLLHD